MHYNYKLELYFELNQCQWLPNYLVTLSFLMRIWYFCTKRSERGSDKVWGGNSVEVCGGGSLSRTRGQEAIKRTYEVVGSILAVSYTDRVSCFNHLSRAHQHQHPSLDSKTRRDDGGWEAEQQDCKRKRSRSRNKRRRSSRERKESNSREKSGSRMSEKLLILWPS